MRVLLVEDDAALARGVVTMLRTEGFTVDRVSNGEDGLAAQSCQPYNAVLLDINLPGVSGFDVLKSLRASGAATPVMMLTARDAVSDRVAGLDLGADDYVLKPFEPVELAARVRALVRRGTGDPQPTLTVGALTLDRSAHTAHLSGRRLNLRPREWAVLEGLVTRAGKVARRERLEAEVFGFDDDVGPNALEVYVGRVRRKLEPDGPLIQTIRGVGYMIEA